MSYEDNYEILKRTQIWATETHRAMQMEDYTAVKGMDLYERRETLGGA